MPFEKIISLASRLFFLAAFVLLGLEIIERIANGAGYTIMLLGRFSAGRLLEIAAVLLVFVIAIQLREIRQELKKRNP
jgi:hypothetical protein